MLKMRMSEKCRNNYNSDNLLTSRRTDGGKKENLPEAGNFSRSEMGRQAADRVRTAVEQNILEVDSFGFCVGKDKKVAFNNFPESRAN